MEPRYNASGVRGNKRRERLRRDTRKQTQKRTALEKLKESRV